MAAEPALLTKNKNCLKKIEKILTVNLLLITFISENLHFKAKIEKFEDYFFHQNYYDSNDVTQF